MWDYCFHSNHTSYSVLSTMLDGKQVIGRQKTISLKKKNVFCRPKQTMPHDEWTRKMTTDGWRKSQQGLIESMIPNALDTIKGSIKLQHCTHTAQRFCLSSDHFNSNLICHTFQNWANDYAEKKMVLKQFSLKKI